MSDQKPIEHLKIGWIPYWNLHPLKQELLKIGADRFELKSAHPVVVNRWLQDGSVHLAPSSSICLVSNPNLEMAIPLGIISNGAAKSVYWGYQREHQPYVDFIERRRQDLKDVFLKAQAAYGCDARNISKVVWDLVRKSSPLNSAAVPYLNFSKNSATSVTLSKIFYMLFFGVDAYQTLINRMQYSTTTETGRTMELVIGDEALQRRGQFHGVLDLGALWKDLTGLPFVFAVWQSKGAFLNGWRRKIMDLGERAEKKMQVEPTVYLPSTPVTDDFGKKLPLCEYWKQIYYRIGSEEMKGLVLFLSLARHFQIVPADDSIMVKLLRWQEISAVGTSSAFSGMP